MPVPETKLWPAAVPVTLGHPACIFSLFWNSYNIHIYIDIYIHIYKIYIYIYTHIYRALLFIT
jgi:hypothetical protein